MHQEGDRSAPAVPLYHELRGEGEPVVFLSSTLTDSGGWEPQWQAYSPPYRLLRCDYPGFGRTPVRAGTLCVARDVAALLDAEGVRGAAFVGCSYGARIALELALARPELVRALVLVGATMPGIEAPPAVRAFNEAEDEALRRGDLDAAVEVNLRTWFDGPDRSPADVDPDLRAAVGAMCRTALEHFLPFLDSVDFEPLVPDLEQWLGEVEQPALVVVGTGDQPHIVRSASLLAAALPNAREATIGGAAHLPSLEQPETFDALVLPFLAETFER
jgi:pimeloyl-ACP methyl ester carboxylesterase